MTERALHTRRSVMTAATVGLASLMVSVAARADASTSSTFKATTSTTTDSLNAWLKARAGAGTSRLTGTVRLTKPLIILSRTTLDATGATITGPARDNIIRNAASIATLVTTASVTAGSAVVTIPTPSFTANMVGQRIQILNVGPNAGRVGAPGSMYGSIISVASPTQVTLDTPATLSSTITRLYLYPHNDSNITIQGGTWINQNKNAQSQTIAGHGILIRRASAVTIRSLTVKSTGVPQQGGQYALSFGDVTDVTAANLAFTNTASDGLHVQGPASGITVQNIVGTNTGDDLVAFTGVDGQSQDGSHLGDCEGDISNVAVQNVSGTSCHSHLKITSGVGAAGVQRHVTGFHASGIAGTATSGPSIAVVNYAGTTSFEGSISRVTATSTGTTPIVHVAAAIITAITVDGVTWSSPTYTPDSGIVNLASPSVGTAVVRNVVMKSKAKSRSAGLGCGLRILSQSIGTLDVSDVQCPVLAPHFDSVQFSAPGITVQRLAVSSDTSSALDGNVLHLTTASPLYSIGSATFTDVIRSTGSLWAADVDGSATVTAIAADRIAGGRALVLLRSPATVSLSNVRQPSPSGAGVRLLSAAAAGVRVVTATSTRPATLISRSATQLVSAVSPTMVVDQTLLTPLDGDIVLTAAQGRIRYSASTNSWAAAA